MRSILRLLPVLVVKTVRVVDNKITGRPSVSKLSNALITDDKSAGFIGLNATTSFEPLVKRSFSPEANRTVVPKFFFESVTDFPQGLWVGCPDNGFSGMLVEYIHRSLRPVFRDIRKVSCFCSNVTT
jgi:hypothetical protein